MSVKLVILASTFVFVLICFFIKDKIFVINLIEDECGRRVHPESLPISSRYIYPLVRFVAIYLHFHIYKTRERQLHFFSKRRQLFR